MNTKAIIWVGLLLQIAFFIFLLFQAPEPHGAIKLGLEKMKANCPSEAPTGIKTADGNLVVSTAGDFFQSAAGGYSYIVNATMSFAVASVIISLFLLSAVRKNK